MRIHYSPEADALSVELVGEARGARTIRHGPDIRLDFDGRGCLVALEVLNASRHYPAAALRALAAPVDYLTLAQAAKEGGLSPATLRVQIHHGRLPAVKRGRDWVVARHELWNYLENRAPSGRPPARPRRRQAPAAR